MEPIRPSRGKARGRPQFPTNQPGVTGSSNLPPQGIRGSRPTTAQPILSSQSLQTPVTDTMSRPPRPMPRPPRPMPPRPTGAPHQRAPRPLGPRPMMSTDNLPRPGMSGGNAPRPGMSGDSVAFTQDPMAGVRIYLKFHIVFIHLYAIFF